MRIKVFALVLLLPALAGCLRENFAEKEQVLSVPEDQAAIMMDAETLGEDNVYSDVVSQLLTVRANRSWSAVIEYEGTEQDWLSLSEEELLNLHEYSVDEPITLKALRNETTSARKAKLIITSDAQHKITIPVEQKAQQRFLEAEADRSEVLSVREEVNVTVRCNTAWSAQVDEAQTTADVKLSAQSGKDNAQLTLTFEENFSAVEGKKAVIKLSAQGVDAPKELVFTQKEGKPYIEFRMTETVLAPEANSVTLQFGASVNWQLSVKETHGIEGAVFSPATGGPTSTGDVVMSFNVNGEDPGESKSITIELSAQGLTPLTYTFTQKGCIHLDFLDWNPTYDGNSKAYDFKWPFASPAKKDIPASASTGTYRGKSLELVMPSGTVFTACSVDWGTSGGIWYNAGKQGFQIGSGKGSYLEFPAVEGLTLKTVIWEPSWLLSTKGKITDAEGNVVTGGEQWDSHGGGANVVTAEFMENHYFNLENTQPGTAYRLVSTNAGVSLNFKDLVLIYE